MKKQNYINNLREYEGTSLREISEKTGHHFNTIKKYADKEDWNGKYERRRAKVSKLEPLKSTIDKWLKEDMKRSRKYRRTATKIYNDLKNCEETALLLEVGKQTVINYVSKLRRGI